jgi:hypothetical protein
MSRSAIDLGYLMNSKARCLQGCAALHEALEIVRTGTGGARLEDTITNNELELRELLRFAFASLVEEEIIPT